ncbi:hypothetical protein K437DRAFT_146412 [Tilletiaria anomala UBC 951]|uniref:Uncharacterized protein n=1 Tax=Tilletiaria anomala (strain ATCC 24038 / CBS 436.72 / UBC 951) TaxID=1037660 RepID=A0A066VZ35_TILAU|nr:uncharacterized protein K437DRAFT_146412 [Tilletiaria anomala UBC 951]KDN43785.1 hypothetical protein K437DRAFT_146412 [Tilletiaria anomala UBC 951]
MYALVPSIRLCRQHAARKAFRRCQLVSAKLNLFRRRSCGRLRAIGTRDVAFGTYCMHFVAGNSTSMCSAYAVHAPAAGICWNVFRAVRTAYRGLVRGENEHDCCDEFDMCVASLSCLCVDLVTQRIL